MNVTDYLVIAAFVISAVVGAMRGFLREAVALVTWLAALFIAWHFADLIEPHLGGLLSGSYVKPWAARVIIVLLILLLGAAIGAMLNHFVRLSIFSGMDRFLGFVFGLLRGVVLLGVFVILGQLLRLDGERWWTRSLLVPYGETVANGLRALVGEQRVKHTGGATVKGFTYAAGKSRAFCRGRPSPWSSSMSAESAGPSRAAGDFQPDQEGATACAGL